jgi:cell division protein FtsQ
MSGAAVVGRSRVGAGRCAAVHGPRVRRRLLALLVLTCVLTGAYLLWLRDIGAVAVQNVEVTGLSGLEGPTGSRVRLALASAARDMTTLHVDRERLERAVEAFPFVRAVEVRLDFPHGLRIRVIEHPQGAVLDLGGRRLAVAGDGSLLAGLPARHSLPVVRFTGKLPRRRLGPGAALDAVRVAAAAPAALAGRVTEVERDGGRGLVARVKSGPDLIFGAPIRLAAKWAAAARVLADPDATGAAYVDLRLPERPAAGGLQVETVAPVAPAAPASTGEAPPSQAGAPGAHPVPSPPSADGGARGGAAAAGPPPPMAAPTPQSSPLRSPPQTPPQPPVGTGGGAGTNP